jgi:hypothetical protein
MRPSRISGLRASGIDAPGTLLYSSILTPSWVKVVEKTD